MALNPCRVRLPKTRCASTHPSTHPPGQAPVCFLLWGSVVVWATRTHNKASDPRVATQPSSPSLPELRQEQHTHGLPCLCKTVSSVGNVQILIYFSPSFSEYALKFQKSLGSRETLQRECGGSPHAPHHPAAPEGTQDGKWLHYCPHVLFLPRDPQDTGSACPRGLLSAGMCSLSDCPFFGDPTVGRTTGPVFCRMPLNLDLSEAFLTMGSSRLLCCSTQVTRDQ